MTLILLGLIDALLNRIQFHKAGKPKLHSSIAALLYAAYVHRIHTRCFDEGVYFPALLPMDNGRHCVPTTTFSP